MAASVTINGPLQIMFAVGKADQSYATIESALLDSGFTDYRIDRQPYEHYQDLTITINPPRDPDTGMAEPFDAEALSRLAEAAAKFGD